MKKVRIDRVLRVYGDQYASISERDQGDERRCSEGSLRAAHAEVRNTQTGNKVVFIYDVLTASREKLAAGEKADVLVMPVPMLDGYAKDGKFGAISTARRSA